MSLFNHGEFQLHSGAQTTFLIDCDALTDEDLDALAHRASLILPSFNLVIGVPRGGMRFAEALDKYTSDEGALLIADDVLTTGTSMEAMRVRDSIGVVIFARGTCPDWVTPLFQMS